MIAMPNEGAEKITKSNEENDAKKSNDHEDKISKHAEEQSRFSISDSAPGVVSGQPDTSKPPPVPSILSKPKILPKKNTTAALM